MQVLESSKLIYAYKRLLFCKGKVAFGFKLKYNKCKGSYDELNSIQVVSYSDDIREMVTEVHAIHATKVFK
ncbi:hypothetical protein NMD99_00635 [Wolbachia endosymbiont of Listronotus oregonensis]|uniref:hypothetical protein n=1 Tax=unclassified Wolbachia TaxID=2640676 RepID=UPI00209D7DD9|nr:MULTISPECIES: hypothetical protein [Rickettsiales]MBV2145723.1 hypothetical protein [Wolbachia endosymbiont of Pissodes strobi]WMT84570.1 hypothetical protein NMD99_00635 [Wolbachia endosymbiont of Listronotus oregonensis]